jgi:hypothetical protein
MFSIIKRRYLHCLEVIVRFVDIGGIVDHHCLEVIVRFVDIGGIVDHHCLSALFHYASIRFSFCRHGVCIYV